MEAARAGGTSQRAHGRLRREGTLAGGCRTDRGEPAGRADAGMADGALVATDRPASVIGKVAICLTQVDTIGCGRGHRSPAPGLGAGGLYRSITRRPTARTRKTPPRTCAPGRRLPARTAGAAPGHGCRARAASNHKILGLPE